MLAGLRAPASTLNHIINPMGIHSESDQRHPALEDPRKWERLKLWCDDASVQDAPHRYRALFVRQDAWESMLNPVHTLEEANAAFGENKSWTN